MMPVVTNRAARRHMNVSGLDGFDAWLAMLLPRAWMARWIAVKILRGYHIVEDLPMLTLLLDEHVVLPDPVTFAWNGRVYEVVDSGGSCILR